MPLLLHLLTDSFDIICGSFLGYFAFSLCSAWLFDDLWRLGNLFYIQDKTVFNKMMQVIRCNIKAVALRKPQGERLLPARVHM